jgi:hypothetical protein
MIAIEAIAELVDEMIDEKPELWGKVAPDSMKNLTILNALETYNNIEKLDVCNDDKVILLISIISYLMLENTAQWVIMERNKCFDGSLNES